MTTLWLLFLYLLYLWSLLYKYVVVFVLLFLSFDVYCFCEHVHCLMWLFDFGLFSYRLLFSDDLFFEELIRCVVRIRVR